MVEQPSFVPSESAGMYAPSGIPSGCDNKQEIVFPGVFAALDAPATFYHPFGMKSEANIFWENSFTALPFGGSKRLGVDRPIPGFRKASTRGYHPSPLRGCKSFRLLLSPGCAKPSPGATIGRRYAAACLGQFVATAMIV
jgi:hypothetical protein